MTTTGSEPDTTYGGPRVHRPESEEPPAFGDFDDFVRARLPHLLRFGRVLTGSDSAAADLVQDALERTLLRWSRIDAARGGDPEGYVRRVMVTRQVSVWRKVRRERLIDQVPELTYDDPAAAEDRPVWEAMVALPPRQRAVIALRYYEDLTEAQTAAVLGVTVGTVKSQASKAMAKLRTLLEEQDDRDVRAGGR